MTTEREHIEPHRLGYDVLRGALVRFVVDVNRPATRQHHARLAPAQCGLAEDDDDL